MINKVILIGNLGRDPEVRTLESGTKVAKFSIATNENYKDKSGEWQQRTEWHDIVAWTYLAEKAERSLKKGSRVYIDGKLTHRKYTDKDGNERYITEVRANVIKTLDPRSDSGEGSSTGGGGYFPSDSDTGADTEEAPKDDPFSGDLSDDNLDDMDEEDDDLPF